MTNEPRPLTEEEIFKIPEQPGVFVLYAGGLPILAEAEEGSLRKRLLPVAHRCGVAGVPRR
jgi:hypothetical protein